MSHLNVNNQQALVQYEAVIEKGLQTFYDVGQALKSIRDQRLYRDQYETFEDYCRERWGFTDERARLLMRSSEVIDTLKETPTIVGVLPQNEAQVRPLITLPTEDRIAVWQEAVETAPNGKVTGAHVQQVADDHAKTFNYKRDAKASRAADEYVPQGYDACQTPAYALDPLLPYLKPEWTIWEPAHGEGYLTGALFDSGFSGVETSDILTGQNFFAYEPPQWDCLVTNPPFSLKFKWLERCYQLGKPFALLVPVEMLGVKTAQELIVPRGFEIMLLNRRVNFKMPNKGWDSSAQFPVMWVCWQLLPEKIMVGDISPHENSSDDSS